MAPGRDFKGRQFTAEVILWAVRWYLMFPISYRDLELRGVRHRQDLEGERGDARVEVLWTVTYGWRHLCHLHGADILHTGDTYWNGFYPFIDYSTGGGLDETIRATEANLAAASDRTIVIPGHGPISNKSQIKDYRDMLVAVREKAAGLTKQGRWLDETVAAKPTAAYDAKWGQFAVSPAFSRSWSTWASDLHGVGMWRSIAALPPSKQQHR